MKWKLKAIDPVPDLPQAQLIYTTILERRMSYTEAARRMRMKLGTLQKIMDGKLVFESPDEFAKAMDLLEAR